MLGAPRFCCVCCAAATLLCLAVCTNTAGERARRERETKRPRRSFSRLQLSRLSLSLLLSFAHSSAPFRTQHTHHKCARIKPVTWCKVGWMAETWTPNMNLILIALPWYFFLWIKFNLNLILQNFIAVKNKYYAFISTSSFSDQCRQELSIRIRHLKKTQRWNLKWKIKCPVTLIIYLKYTRSLLVIYIPNPNNPEIFFFTKLTAPWFTITHFKHNLLTKSKQML